MLALREVMSEAGEGADADVMALAGSVEITREHFERVTRVCQVGRDRGTGAELRRNAHSADVRRF